MQNDVEFTALGFTTGGLYINQCLFCQTIRLVMYDRDDRILAKKS
jgi:hypothetical protein